VWSDFVRRDIVSSWTRPKKCGVSFIRVVGYVSLRDKAIYLGLSLAPRVIVVSPIKQCGTRANRGRFHFSSFRDKHL
jgi:hypothetical protein